MARGDGEQLTLDVDPPDPPPVTVIARCHYCGAGIGPIPLTDSGDVGDRWTGCLWAYVELKGHWRDGCPNVPEQLANVADCD